MKIPVVLVALLALPCGLNPMEPGDAGAAAGQDRFQEFGEKFRKAMKIGSMEEMGRLLRTYQREAIHAIIQTCEFISTDPTEQLEILMEAYRRAWKVTYKTEFVDRQYEYFSLMRPEVKDHRRKLKVRYDQNYRKFAEAEKSGEQTKFGVLAMEFGGLAEDFGTISDHYYASNCWLYVAKAYDEALRGDQADLKRACEAYGKVLEERTAVGLRDSLFGETKARYDHLEKQGYGDPEKAADYLKPRDAASAPKGAALATSFELVSDIDSIRRPTYYGDEIYAMWVALSLGLKGSSTTLVSNEDSPSFIRESASKVVIDVDGDGQGDQVLPTSGRITPVTVTIGEGEEQRQWGFLTAVGGQQDTYNGIQFNLAPTDEFWTIYTAPAASVVTMVADTQLRVIDDNMDGIYGSEPKEWGHVGLIEESFQRDVDSVVIGESKRAVPWSEFLKIGEQWYRMESLRKGLEIVAAAVNEMPTGTIKLAFKGGKPDWLIVRGTGPFENCLYDLVAGGSEGVEVPAGRYELYIGQLSKGKKRQRLKALILPSSDTPAWTVEGGGTATVELGSPFGFVFRVEQDAESVTVIGDSIAVQGRGQETYQRLWNCVVRPDVSIRRSGSRRGSKGEGMKGIGVQEETAERGFQYVWFPFDLTLKKKKKGEEMEVQLVQKKNKLFGKIQSEWTN